MDNEFVSRERRHRRVARFSRLSTLHETPARSAVELRDGPMDRQKMKTKMQDVDKAMVLTFNETFEL